MKLPDVTLAQILAAASWVAGEAVTMGLCDSETSKFILSVGVTALTAAWTVGDAVIRHGRSRALAPTDKV